MLEGKIKLHGEQGCGKTELLRAIEELLRQPKFRHFKIVCRTQLPGQPDQVEAVFRKGGQEEKLKSTWGGE